MHRTPHASRETLGSMTTMSDFPTPPWSDLEEQIVRLSERVAVLEQQIRPARQAPSALSRAARLEQWLYENPGATKNDLMRRGPGRWSRRKETLTPVLQELAVRRNPDALRLTAPRPQPERFVIPLEDLDAMLADPETRYFIS